MNSRDNYPAGVNDQKIDQYFGEARIDEGIGEDAIRHTLIGWILDDLAEEKTMKNPDEKHREKYDKLCEELGVRWDPNDPPACPIEKWRAIYREDPHLNNIPLQWWDMMAMQIIRPAGSHLSLAELVCVQKNACRRMLEEAREVGDG